MRCAQHRWHALAYVSEPAYLAAVWAKDPEAVVDGVGSYMYQDGPDRFIGSGPAAWVHLGDTGGFISCGRERGELPRQVAPDRWGALHARATAAHPPDPRHLGELLQ